MWLPFTKKCPCCKKRKKKDNTIVLREFVGTLFRQDSWWVECYFGSEKKMVDFYTSFQSTWACDNCIKNKVVLLGDSNEQRFCASPPYFIYQDDTRTCRNCKKKFTFTKGEQKFWYETLKFWVQSEAVNCKICRRVKRQRKDKVREAQKLLETLIPNLNTKSIEELEQVLELYKLTESRKKVKYYSERLDKLRNLKANSEENNLTF